MVAVKLTCEEQKWIWGHFWKRCKSNKWVIKQSAVAAIYKTCWAL